MKNATPLIRCAAMLVVACASAGAGEKRSGGDWREALASQFGQGPVAAVAKTMAEKPDQRAELAVVADWIAQDTIDGPSGLRTEAVESVIEGLKPPADALRARLAELKAAPVAATDRRWADLYFDACLQRRQQRLEPHRAMLGRVVFTQHYDMGGSHYAYTEGQSDAQAERHFQPGSALCMLELDGPFARVRPIIEDPAGVLRDPDVSYDGKRVLFAWKKSLNDDDYHLYELDAASGRVRQLTFGLGFADYEGCYLPNGDIIFNSSRCVQTVDCWWTEVSNLFTCDGDGRYLRRLSYDQVHTNYPTVTWDGRIVYTRWDYNDRGQIYPQGVFQMNPDGTSQRELYGNNSWFPTTILHARSIPGTQKYVAVLSGHHTKQQGWLGIVDPARGRQEASGIQLIAPVRKTEAVRVDRYGQTGDQFQYPYPLNEREFLVTFHPAGAARFGIYYMTAAGERELLVSDAKISCNQPVPLAARPAPPMPGSRVDYTQRSATLYVQDVYSGAGLGGVPRGTIQSLRVVAIEFRAAGVGHNGNRGPAGGALVSTPISIEGTWDVKRVLGTAQVHADGSAAFQVPAKTPLYLQALDTKGHAVQTMRSWTTLQPGEVMSCVGCHDDKNTSPPPARPTLAAQAGPQDLTPWYGPPRGFSFVREVQPVLDRHCTRCHFRDEPPVYGKAKPAQAATAATEVKPAFSLSGKQTFDSQSLRRWSDSYKALANRHVANWINIQSEPTMLPPYHAGATNSKLIQMLEAGHYGVKLSAEEMDRFATWIDLLVPYCGDYREGLEGEALAKYQRFLDKRRRWQAEEAWNIAAFLRDRSGRPVADP